MTSDAHFREQTDRGGLPPRQVGDAPAALLLWGRLIPGLLLALAAIFSTIPLADAQMMQDEGDETVAGRVVVRVHGLAAGQQDGAYRMEFGFMTETILEGAESWSAAIGASERLLPSSRFMSETAWLRRAEAENRSWVSSSLIRIPIMANDGREQSTLVGRVIARWNPASDGSFRIEFGFLPEWSLDETGDADDGVYGKVQQAAARYQSLLPQSRYLSSDRIATELSRQDAQWLRSSSIEVPLERPPLLSTRVSCSPLSINIGASVDCEAAASGGAAPYSYSWDAHGASPASGSGQSLRLTFYEPGSYPIEATATDSRGQIADGRTIIEVEAPPIIAIALCVPSSIQEGGSTNCEASAGGGAPPYMSYSWSVPGASPSSGSGRSIQLTFDDPGSYPVEVTVADSRGLSAVGSTSVDVEAVPPTVTVACQPPSIEERRSTTCEASADGGAPPYTSYSWNAPGASPSSGSGRNLQLTFDDPGSYPVEVTVADSRGLRAVGRTSVEVEGVPPTVTVTCQPSSIPASGWGATICEVSADGGVRPYVYSWNVPGASPSSGSSLNLRLTFANPGSYPVEVTVEDSRGLRAVGSTSVEVEELTWPTVSVSCSPSSVPEGTLVHATCSANVSGGVPPYTYSWTAPSASPSSGSGESIWLTFDGVGSLVEVTVEDAHGNRADGRTDVGVKEAPLTVTVTCTPSTISVGESTSCVTQCSGKNSGNLCQDYRLWGVEGPEVPRAITVTPRPGQEFTLAWQKPGTYSVRVRVSNRIRWKMFVETTVTVVER